MKKRAILIFLLAISTALNAQKIVFMPQWTAQSQFAGYYVAQEKGFYKAEGLDVEIRHIKPGSTMSVTDYLMRGDVDIAGIQLLSAIISRNDGDQLLNVMQLSQVSGLCLAAHFKVRGNSDLNGKKIGRWLIAYEEFAEVLELFENVRAEWITAYNPVNLFLYDVVDATLCTSYNELIDIRLSGHYLPDDRVLRFSDEGLDCPEDGLYVTEEGYQKKKALVDKFVEASKKGWEYARLHPEEAVDITMKYTADAGFFTNTVKQRMILDECLRLQVNPRTGKADFAPVSKEVFKSLNDVLYKTGTIQRIVDYKELIR